MYDGYWQLDTTLSPVPVTSGASATVVVVAVTPSSPYTSVETRTYTLTMMFVAMYTMYIACSNLIYHFFGQPGTSNPFGYCAAFVQASHVRIMKSYGEGDTLPFNNLPTANQFQNLQRHDVNTLTERVLNLEAVLADYYIDVGRFQTISKAKAEEFMPKSSARLVSDFVVEVVKGEKDNFKTIATGGVPDDGDQSETLIK